MQAKGFSPVCPLICSFKWLFLLNPFAQNEQTKGLSFSDLTRALKSSEIHVINMLCTKKAQMQSYYYNIIFIVKVLSLTNTVRYVIDRDKEQPWGSSIILDQNKQSVTQ